MLGWQKTTFYTHVRELLTGPQHLLKSLEKSGLNHRKIKCNCDSFVNIDFHTLLASLWSSLWGQAEPKMGPNNAKTLRWWPSSPPRLCLTSTWFLRKAFWSAPDLLWKCFRRGLAGFWESFLELQASCWLVCYPRTPRMQRTSRMPKKRLERHGRRIATTKAGPQKRGQRCPPPRGSSIKYNVFRVLSWTLSFLGWRPGCDVCPRLSNHLMTPMPSICLHLLVNAGAYYVTLNFARAIKFDHPLQSYYYILRTVQM